MFIKLSGLVIKADFVLKASIHFLTQSWDLISCYGKPVAQTIEIILRPISLICSTGFLQQLILSHNLEEMDQGLKHPQEPNLVW